MRTGGGCYDAPGRIGEPDETAGAGVFFASDAASFITGQTLMQDAGGVA